MIARLVFGLLLAGFLGVSQASAQTYRLSGDFNTGTGSLSGNITVNPATGRVTRADVAVTAGTGASSISGPMSARSSTLVVEDGPNVVRLRESPVNTGVFGLFLVFNPQLDQLAPVFTAAIETRCFNADCSVTDTGRQNLINRVLTRIPGITSLSSSAAPPGSTVVITGTDFTGATAVAFGATPAAAFTVNSATQITATVPAVAPGTTVDIAVTGPTGSSPNTTADNFLFPAPVPTMAEWAMIALGLLLAMGAAVTIQRRRLAA
ncbi:IPTL-CTERM sorting domain-containing protein [Brevundimonas sp.]|uniref:IPTL-CTERM sorting domain-containing protein n=1 Tax=Brevundimonas sp. TaxID=1871086 RepID=UPI00260B3532|nr:IPTL-CTERM sorting domain-containing protein [Brevundimonas sp.]